MMKVFIAGAGTMGSGISQVFAQAGHEVALYDIKGEFVDRDRNAISNVCCLLEWSAANGC